MARKYPDPSVLRTFQTWVVKQTRVQRVTDRASGELRRRNVNCWDVKGKCDGVQWSKRFRKAGLAETWRERAERDFIRGLPFDLKTKQFVEWQAPTGPVAPTVFALTELYFNQHPEWEPATKEAAARSYNRARRWLLVHGAELDGDDLVAVEDYLDHASFLPVRLAGKTTDRLRAGQRWLETHSAPADALTSKEIEEFVSWIGQGDFSRSLAQYVLQREHVADRHHWCDHSRLARSGHDGWTSPESRLRPFLAIYFR